jgi:hypothetical protein
VEEFGRILHPLIGSHDLVLLGFEKNVRQGFDCLSLVFRDGAFLDAKT